MRFFIRCVHIGGVAFECFSAQSVMPVTSQLLRGLPRAKVFVSSLVPCQHHQNQFGLIAPVPALRQRHRSGRSYQTSSRLHSYILTPPQVNSILKANEYSFKVCRVLCRNDVSLCECLHFHPNICFSALIQVPEFDGKNVSSVMGFESNQLPANAPIEDRRSAATCLQTRGMLLGVFDGHAGCACAQVNLLRFMFWFYIFLLLLFEPRLCLEGHLHKIIAKLLVRVCSWYHLIHWTDLTKTQQMMIKLTSETE